MADTSPTLATQLVRIEVSLTEIRNAVNSNTAELRDLTDWRDGHDLKQMSTDIQDLITLFYGSERDKSSALLPQVKALIEAEKARAAQQKAMTRSIQIIGGVVGVTNIPEILQLLQALF